MANEYMSGFTLDGLVVPTKAATIYAAQEQSLFLSGNLIPMVNVPAGSQSAQVPVLGAVTGQAITADAGADLTVNAIADQLTCMRLVPLYVTWVELIQVNWVVCWATQLQQHLTQQY
jgi:hypothetical protein